MYLLIMGAPGSGKGTCCAELSAYYNIPHISTGDMFREAIKQQTPIGKVAKNLIDKGEFVPDSVTNELVRERLSLADCNHGFILDGYPRNLNQAKEFEKILKELNIQIDYVLNLQIDDSLIVDRIVNRRICTKCGTGYNLKSLPPKVDGICDKCGAPLYTRADDNEETINNRLRVYYEQTEPLIDFYQKQGKILNIDAANQIGEVIFEITSKVKR